MIYARNDTRDIKFIRFYWPLLYLLLFIIVFLPACQGDGDEPQTKSTRLSEDPETIYSADPKKSGIPDPLPVPKWALIRNTNPGFFDQVEIKVIGMPGSVAGAGTVTITKDISQEMNLIEAKMVQVQSTAAGSFVASIVSHADEELFIQFNNSPLIRYQVALDYSDTTPYPIPPLVEDPTIVRLSPERIQIKGYYNKPIGTQMIGINPISGDVALADLNQDHQFIFEIAAKPDDLVQIYADLFNPPPKVWELIAP